MLNKVKFTIILKTIITLEQVTFNIKSIIQYIVRQYKNQVKQSMIIKKLGQYGGYLLSGILIAWLINPIAAIAFLEFFLKMTLLISIPAAGAYILDKIILLKHQKAWNILLPTWIIVSIYLSFSLVKLLEGLIN